MFSFNGDPLKVGDSIISADGTSGIIISKTTNEGIVTYKDHKGNNWIANPEELMITKNLKNVQEGIDPTQTFLKKEQWYNVIKFIIAVDILKGNGIGGGILHAGTIFPKWRDKVSVMIEKLKGETSFILLKAQADKTADKFYHNANINSILAELQQYPHTDLSIKKNFIKKREFNKLQDINNKRKDLIKKLANEVWQNLDEEEKQFLSNLTKKLQPVVDEFAQTIGTGTYTSTSSDQNYMTSGTYNNQDTASGGSYPVYIQ
jgi:hypothetical protein